MESLPDGYYWAYLIGDGEKMIIEISGSMAYAIGNESPLPISEFVILSGAIIF